MARKSAARMRPKRGYAVKGTGKNAIDNINMTGSVTRTIPPSKVDYDATSSRRNPLALLLRRVSVAHVICSNDRESRKNQRKASTRLRFGRPFVPILMTMAFVTASVVAITIGNDTSMQSDSNIAATSTSSSASYETTRVQHDALVRTGLFSMMSLDGDVTVAELMDATINPDELDRYDAIRKERDARKMAEAESEGTYGANAGGSGGNDNEPSDNSTSNNQSTDNATQPSGSLTEEQMGNGKLVIDEAVSQYNQDDDGSATSRQSQQPTSYTNHARA